MEKDCGQVENILIGVNKRSSVIPPEKYVYLVDQF